ncbi:MAG: hypothetical protein MR487_03375 [Lachnospiraceae bacterium]|nr:hypothetical protein [Lachnospiraceae bacterium]
MKKKFICPNCYREVKCQDVQFRCTEPFCDAKEADERYQRYLLSITNDTNNFDIQNDLLMGKVFSGKKGFWAKAHLTGGAMPFAAVCPECGSSSNTRVCPECHCELPDNFDEVNTLVFGILGVRGVSKSTYIAVLVNELKKRLAGSDLDASFILAMDDDSIRYNKYYFNPIYNKRKTIGGTQVRQNRDASTFDFKKPLTFKLTIRGKTTNIVIYDIAGEDCLSSGSMKSAARYLPHADGLICIIDPLYLETFRNKVDPKIVEACSVISDEEARAYEPETLFNNIKGIINSGGMINIPISIAVSKADLIQMLPNAFPRGGRAQDRNSEIIVNRKFNRTECEEVSNEVSKFLELHGGKNAVKFIGNHFANYSFSTFSALGDQPQNVAGGSSYDGNVAEPHPIRIADSLYYLLHKNNVI